MKKHLLIITIVIILCDVAKAQLITIAAARTMSTGATVTVRGIVTNGDELGTIRYFQDGTGGIAAYDNSMAGVQRGDSVEVTGVISPYQNLIELNPVNSYTVISTGNPSPEPHVTTMLNGYSESYESQLVRFNNSGFLSTGNFAGNTNYNATDNSVVSAQVRINVGSNIVGTPIPGGTLDLVGIMSQFGSSYQLLPRDLNDFVVGGNPPVFTSSLIQLNISPNSFDVSFTTLNPGSTILYYGITTSLGSVASNTALVNNHSLQLSGLTAATLYYVQAATVSASGDTSFSGVLPMMTQSLSSGNILCYFTRSVDNSVAQGANAVSLAQTMDDTLIAYMNRAVYTMDIAIYNMDNDNGIVDAINAAYNRGVVVRMIGDGANMDGSAWAQLNIGTNSKKLSPTGVDYGIMHNKFMIIDADAPDPMKSILWTGSMNFTDQQVNTDANNVIIFKDQSLARAYEIEFNEMWSGIFGPFKSNNTPKEFNVGGSRVELYFSPSDDTESEIKRTATSADHDLEFSVFAYTRFNISYAIDDRLVAGVWGGGIIDDTSNGSYSYSVLAPEMVNRLFVANHSYLLHHKYLLTDANAPGLDPAVLTGSHNWSTSAQFDNDENTVVVHNASIANQYFQEWVARYHDEGGSELPSYIVGIPEPENSALQLAVYPNPAAYWLKIYCKYPSNENASLTISDLSGRTVLEQEIKLIDGITSPLNISSITPGLYLIRLSDGLNSMSAKLAISR